MRDDAVDWLRQQRWFRSKQRRVSRVEAVDVAALGPSALTVLDVAYADGGPSDRYLAPLVREREPLDGEGAWSALVDAIAAGGDVPSDHGRFVFHRTDALAGLLPASRDERRLGVEQSNTSVTIGDRLILKLYRLLEPGDNPDVEVSAFLTDAAFPDTPALAGWVTYELPGKPPATAAMLSELVPGTGDGWRTMLTAFAGGGAPAELAGRVGGLTARLHAALASRPEDPAFPWRPATPAETGSWRASAERQLAQAIEAVVGDDHARLVRLAPAIRARFADAFGSATGTTFVGRVHGDYHLGQLLAREDGGFSVIDFEGEPARPLAERRAPTSPLRDVAGMLRSLDYAARTAERDGGPPADRAVPALRTAFLDAYGELAPGDRSLLAAFELEKACYEVRYEAGNRPGWLWLPLSALERAAAAP